MRVFISASLNEMPWNSPIFCPKASRVAGVFQAGFVGRLGNAQRLGGNADAPGVQHGHGDLETFAFFPQAVGNRRAVIFEDDLAGGRGADAQLGLLLAAHKAGPAGIDHEGGDAPVLLLRVGHGEQHQVIGHRTAGDPGFAPVDDVIVAIAHRPAAHRAGV